MEVKVTEWVFEPGQSGLKSLDFIITPHPVFGKMLLKRWDGEQKGQCKKEKLTPSSQTRMPSLPGPSPPHPPPLPGAWQGVSPEGVL